MYHISLTIPFVGNKYYCELGTSISKGWVLYPNDPSGMVKTVVEMRLPVVLLLR